MKQYWMIIILFFSLFLLICCEKDNIEQDPHKAILGKWECIAIGDGTNMYTEKPTGYEEYLPDSVLRVYDYETDQYNYAKYWIDSLLYESVTREDGVQVITGRYEILFSNNNNQLRKELYHYPVIFPVSIHRRIK